LKKFPTISFLAVLLLFTLRDNSYSQVELIDVNDNVYSYLERMYNKGIVEYNSASLPLSKDAVSKLLAEINNQQSKLTSTDKNILKKYYIEYNIEDKNENELGFFNKPKFSDIFNNHKQKYLYIYKDSTFRFYLDGIGSFTERISRGDSMGNHKSLMGELGFRIKANFNGILAAYLRASNNAQVSGNETDFDFVRRTNPKIDATGTVSYGGRTYYNNYEGYLRYQAKTNWVAVSLGRYPIVQGMGFIDNLFLSRNSIPYDFVKLDLSSKVFKYTFSYGSIRGDSLGKKLESKNISTHRLDINFSNKFKVGLFEAVIIPNSAFSFTFLNPISFLSSAEFNKPSQGYNEDINNTMLGIDALVKPVNNLSFQGSLLVDDLEFSTLFKPESKEINKFAYQLGGFWSDAFTIPNLELKLEYTKIDPFVYSHTTNKSTYANWGYSLGHALPPNSDEIAVQLNYPVSSRVRFSVDFKFQRSGDGNILDSLGRFISVSGGDINKSNGVGNAIITPVFLQGDRKNRTILNFHAEAEPIKQYYLTFDYTNKMFDNIFESRKMTDNYFVLGLRVDY
jgi:hypothetical protein